MINAGSNGRMARPRQTILLFFEGEFSKHIPLASLHGKNP